VLNNDVYFYVSDGDMVETRVESSGYVARLPSIFEESKEFLTVKQHLDAQLKSALEEPQAETPEFATNFPWQVSLASSLVPLVSIKLQSGCRVVFHYSFETTLS